MTERDGTPLPWGESREFHKASNSRYDYEVVRGPNGGVSMVVTAQGEFTVADNPLDQLCDALHIRQPRGVERVRAMDAIGRLIREPRPIDDGGIDRTLPSGTIFQPDDPGPAGAVGG
jgi:hypothetical protein